MGRLLGKRVVITGGTSGIGRATVLRCLEEGASVLFTGRSETGARQTLAAAAPFGDAVSFVEQDITSPAAWHAVAEATKDRLGGVDAVINNAGTFFVDTIENTTPERFESMWTINVDGVFLGTQFGASAMQDNENGGSIVTVASLSGLIGHELCAAYCSTKAAAIMMMKSAATELAPNIRANAVAPGPIWNELLQGAHADDDAEQIKQFYRDTSPLKVLGESNDVAEAIVYLASDESRSVTGTVMRIDAGRGSD